MLQRSWVTPLTSVGIETLVWCVIDSTRSCDLPQLVPRAQPSQHPKRHLDRFGRFCSAHERVQPSDRSTTLLADRNSPLRQVRCGLKIHWKFWPYSRWQWKTVLVCRHPIFAFDTVEICRYFGSLNFRLHLADWFKSFAKTICGRNAGYGLRFAHHCGGVNGRGWQA